MTFDYLETFSIELINFDKLKSDIGQELLLAVRQDALDMFEQNTPNSTFANMLEASLLAEFLYSQDIL